MSEEKVIESEVTTEVATIDATSIAVANPNDWEARLAQFAVAAVASEAAPAGSFITAKAGVLQWQGQAVAGNKLDVVIIDSVFENALYEGDYDPDNPTSPVCFAFAHTEDDLKPHEKSSKPQHETCAGCPHNEFGSAERGKGKACKNIRRLAMLSASPLEASALEGTEVAFMKLPVTSSKNWINYVNTLATIDKRPPFAVVTTLGAVPDPKTQFKITFTKKELVTDGEVLNVLFKRHDAQKATAIPPYQANSATEKPVKAKSKKF